jgi:hypothetical protein
MNVPWKAPLYWPDHLPDRPLADAAAADCGALVAGAAALEFAGWLACP